MFPGLSEQLEEWLTKNPSKSELKSLLADIGGDNAVQFANTTSLVSGLWKRMMIHKIIVRSKRTGR